MPHKNWAVGDEVLAVDMNNYLANQVVSTHATAAARATAITTPVKGMCSTRDDLPGVVEVYDGAAWVASFANYTSGNWSTYVPAWRAGGSSAGLAIGTGGTTPGLTGAYRMLCPYVMALAIQFRVGTTGYNGGTGAWDFGLPPGTGGLTTPGVGASLISGGVPMMGTSLIGSVVYPGAIHPSTFVPNWWSSSHPLTWTNAYVGQVTGTFGIVNRWVS